jgi:hypothetical protein
MKRHSDTQRLDYPVAKRAKNADKDQCESEPDDILSLNDDCLGVIMGYLGLLEAERISQVHPILEGVSKYDFLWKDMYKHVYGYTVLHSDTTLSTDSHVFTSNRSRALFIMHSKCATCGESLKDDVDISSCTMPECSTMDLLCHNHKCSKKCYVCQRDYIFDTYQHCDINSDQCVSCERYFHDCCAITVACESCGYNTCNQCPFCKHSSMKTCFMCSPDHEPILLVPRYNSN